MKKIIATSAAALVALIAVSGIAMSSFAAETDSSGEVSDWRPMRSFHQNLTDEEKAEFQAQREERMAEREAKREAVQVALESGDYNAWVEAVGEGCPMLDKITSENFSEFIRAHDLREEARGIMGDLGIERGEKGNKGMKGGFGGGIGMRGMHF